MVICSYKVTAKLSNVSISEVQVNLVFNGEYSHPNYRVFQQYLPKADVRRFEKRGIKTRCFWASLFVSLEFLTGLEVRIFLHASGQFAENL